MKLLPKILLSFFLLVSIFARSQNPPAPITTAASVTNATTAPGLTTVPVTVTGFMDMGYCKLTLMYRSNLLTFISATTNPAFTGMSVNNTVLGTSGKIVITWSGTYGITLPDLTHLVDLVFTYISSTSLLTWSTGSTTCIYKQYAGGLFTTCNDQPYSTHYITGGVSNQGAPVTFAPVQSNATSGSYLLPINVNNFSGISSVSLILEYDPNILTYDTAYLNPTLGGSFSVGIQPGALGKMNINIGWFFGATLGTLANGSTLVTLNLNYSHTYGGYSTLNWIQPIENGSSCFYSDGSYYRMIDSPTKDYFINGLIYSSNQYSPQTWLPSITNASTGCLSVPVNVSGFTNVNSFTLSFYFDPAVMTYSGFVQNSSLPGTVNIANNAPDTSGKRRIVMTWTGSSPQSLPAGSSLGTLNFTYISGASTLKWVTDAASCRFNDANGNAYYDLPKSNYYQNGMVASHPAPLTAAWYGNCHTGETLTIPVNVWHYTNIGSFYLTMSYDPGVLTNPSANLVPSFDGMFTFTNTEPGSLVLAWNGTATSLPDNSDLVDLTFTYNGGNTPLEWYTAGTSCQYAEGATLPALYDIPKANYYVNGNVGPNPVIANFSTSNTSPAINTTVTFSDLTTGSPDAWNWNFNPCTVMYVDSTNSSSKNPHVQFTTPGNYTVTLIASRGTSSNVSIKTNYIIIPGLWTGITSVNWSTASNWNNSILPTSTTDVMIPASAPNWPVITGDLAIGTQCNSITMAGPSSLTVNGNFTIYGGSSLTFMDADTLKISGNWSNSGIFNSGVGTVEFIGSTDGTIRGATETFYNLIEAKTNAILNVPNTITVNGNFILK
jgi:PKD repeat protein